MKTIKRMLGKITRRAASQRALYKYRETGQRCPFLLVDTPEHGNIGDQAIALAEQQLLDGWFGSGSYYEITANQIDGFEKDFAKYSPVKQVILVHGGGFLGTLWPNEEYRFRRILEAFSDHKVVVFPQTVTFVQDTDKGRAFFEESIRTYTAHPDLVVYCRELMSLALMRESFSNVQAELAPDVVFALNVPNFDAVRDCVLLCMRGDKERIIDDGQTIALMNAIEDVYPGVPIKKTDTVVPRRVPMSHREQEIYSKLHEFSCARLVVTDRLHGMIFAAITGTPCIALNNSNGKVEAVYNWISDLPFISFSNSIADAITAIGSKSTNPEHCPFEHFLPMLSSIRQQLDGSLGPNEVLPRDKASRTLNSLSS